MTKPIDFTRVFDILRYQVQKYPQQAALNFQQAGTWQKLSVQDIEARVNKTSDWLWQAGFRKGDCIAIVPRMGHPDWLILDFACQQLGLVTVPIHPTASVSEMKFILDEVAAKACITADVELKSRAAEVFPNPLYGLDEFANGYFPEMHTHIELRPEISIVEDDLVCILYTSGTTGEPKGTMLTHQNIVSNIKSILPLFPINPGDRVLSFLPFSHIFERSACYAYIAFGASVYFSSDLKGLSHDFKTVRPVFITSVPKTLERMYDFLLERSRQKNAWKRRLVRWAMRVGERYPVNAPITAGFAVKLWLARVLVLNAWRKALSSRIKYIVVGAASLRSEIGQLFWAAGVTTLSGYGMTEASPFITANRPQPGMNKFGSVGLPVPGVDIRLVELNESGEGEIQVRGANIMQGYFKRPELTDEVFTPDGWLRTGDIGKMDKRFLVITGRKKDLFKTTAGIYIAPQELESKLCASAYIAQGLVVGLNKPYVAAILVPHFGILKSWCDDVGIHWTSPQFMVHNIKVIQKINEEIEVINQTLPGYKKIKKFILADKEWTVDGGELTPSFKLIRSMITKQFDDALKKIYSR